MDNSRSLRRFEALGVGPSPRLVGTRSEESLQSEECVCALDKTAHARLFNAQLLQEDLALLVAVQLGNVSLGCSCHNEQFGILLLDSLAHRIDIGVARNHTCLINIADIQHGFVGQQTQLLHPLCIFLVVNLHRASSLTLLHSLLVAAENVVLTLCDFVARGSLLLCLTNAVLDGFEVLHNELGVDNLFVPHGVYRAVNVGNVLVVEAAQNVNNRIGIANVGKEFIAQALAPRSAFHQTCNIDNLDGGRYHTLGVVNLGELGKPLVGYGDYAHIGVDGAEREVCRLCLGVRQTVEKGTLAHIGETHYAAL